MVQNYQFKVEQFQGVGYEKERCDCIEVLTSVCSCYVGFICFSCYVGFICLLQ